MMGQKITMTETNIHKTKDKTEIFVEKLATKIFHSIQTFMHQSLLHRRDSMSVKKFNAHYKQFY